MAAEAVAAGAPEYSKVPRRRPTAEANGSMSELDDVWVSVEQLDASFQEHSASAATATAAVNASVVSLQREAQSDRQALRGLMEMMEDQVGRIIAFPTSCSTTSWMMLNIPHAGVAM